jgi:hypothetical protein
MHLIQTIQFQGVATATLFRAYLDSAEHGKMTTSGEGEDKTTWFRPGVGNVATAVVGDELRCWGFRDENGSQVYNLKATILELVPNELIVQMWKNIPFTLATNPSLISEVPSTLVLRFRKTAFGSEIHMVHANVPDYEVFIEPTGERDALGNIINTHWGLQYWEPMQKYFGSNK